MRKGDRTHARFYNEIKETNTRLKANQQSKSLTGLEIIEITTVAQYLDNIQEPPSSIIRNSKPRNLEEAYQVVLLQSNISQPNPRKQSTLKKPAFKPKPRAEAHNNSVQELNDSEPPIEVPTENDDREYSDEELKFQTAGRPKMKT